MMSASIRYLSVCSGIEAASAAWMPLGWRPVAFSEIESFPASVLAHHHPGKDSADGPRYKALGNSWAVNCARWIGERIASVDCIAAGDAA